MRTRKPKGPKRVSYELIDPASKVGAPMYALLRSLVREDFQHVLEARIALAWCTSWKPDVDGHLTLGKCKKASDLDRELAAYDFVILLRKVFWLDLFVTQEMKTQLLYHELCHAGVACDPRSGEVIRDERGRQVFRLVKHDIEEFTAVVAKFGWDYKRDQQVFAQTVIARSAQQGFQGCDACRDTHGWVAASDNTVTRCACYQEWLDRRREALAS